MGTGTEITDNHIEGFKEEVAKAAQQDPAVFFNWFNEAGGDVDYTFLKGRAEFNLYMLLPMLKRMKHLKEKTALEIGSGGGRLVAAAASEFGNVIGVDIHENQHIVASELARRGIDNVTLLQGHGKDLPVESTTVDLVYSFIVLQHVEKIEIFLSYLEEAYRVLKPGGYAVLFFGRLYDYSNHTESRLRFALDRFLEAIHPKGYREIEAKVNCVNLTVSMKFAQKHLQDLGFSIVQEGTSRHLPDLKRYGGQYFVVVQKPDV